MVKNAFLLFLFACVSTLTAQNKEWVKVKDTVNAFVVEFPAQPQKGVEDVPTVKGSVKMDSYTLQTVDDDILIYMTSFTKYPKSFFENGLDTFEEQNKVLNGNVQGVVSNTKGTLVSDKKITFNGYNGRGIVIELNSTPSVNVVYLVQMKIVLVDYNLYLAQVIYEKKNAGNINAKRFFESFELIKVKQ
ncbi:hypothetical protein [Flavivirga eckloniae]|uniref:Lipid/polyisoprenoid-binding YceI-like domain-containing protein n=1 Tax=Flavivirga eckloniae TaxID=1803846 RepID=A0A2K9PJT0_9FLAO|nr:hypothetical protein [Flavivirga eckloniae]AUP77296.1 hypothetical protein C1H87_00600 [Flavivirga eckloniae]